MPNSQKKNEMPKWLISVPLLLLALVLTIVTLPVTLVLTLLISFLPNYRGALRALLFFLCYLLCETAGVLVSVAIWLRYRSDQEQFLAANFVLQCKWAKALMDCATFLFQLKFRIHHPEALDGPSVILLPRHASIADTVLPMTYYAVPQNRRLRYVLKRELQWDPCLEIVGNRLPNLFVDRSNQNTEEEVARVAHLLETCPADEGVLLYPEGTRFSKAKHKELQLKAEPNSVLAEQIERWPELLPPRLGGCLGLLGANKHHDLLFFAHSGFEGSASFAELMNGSWCHSEVHLDFWRVPFAEIPVEPDEQKQFLFRQWDEMHRRVEHLNQLRGV